MTSQLSFSRMIAYAAGGVAMNLTNLVISQWLLICTSRKKAAIRSSPA